MTSSSPHHPDLLAADAGDDDLQEDLAPVCVMSFNASDPSGSAGLSADQGAIASMLMHALPVVTSVLMRDTAEVFDQHALDADAVAEQARTVLEDIAISGWKVGFLGSAEAVSAVAEILSDYPDVPLVSYLPNLGWMDDDEAQNYLEAFRDLILPATEVLVGNHKTLTDFLLPEWDGDRPPSERDLAVAAGERGTRYVLVTGNMATGKEGQQVIDNVLASPQGKIFNKDFDLIEHACVGAGDTLSAALASLLAAGHELHEAVVEALSYMDHTLAYGFQPGMGGWVPDRYFWALPPTDEDGMPLEEGMDADAEVIEPPNKGAPRRVH